MVNIIISHNNDKNHNELRSELINEEEEEQQQQHQHHHSHPYLVGWTVVVGTIDPPLPHDAAVGNLRATTNTGSIQHKQQQQQQYYGKEY